MSFTGGKLRFKGGGTQGGVQKKKKHKSKHKEEDAEKAEGSAAPVRNGVPRKTLLHQSGLMQIKGTDSAYVTVLPGLGT